MSIIVSDIRLPFGSSDNDAVTEALKLLKASASLLSFSDIHKVSYDLRHGKTTKVFSVELEFENEEQIIKRNDSPNVKLRAKAAMPSPCGQTGLNAPPAVIGFGPAGLFAALILARNGYRPVIFERGGAMPERDRSVDRFFGGGRLDLSSNIQFGEGGAGTYSDGKLTTRINDARCQLVLDILRDFGAEREMLVKAKPHIGTDRLKSIVTAIREEIILLGGSVHFLNPIREFKSRNGRLTGLIDSFGEYHETDVAVLAIGHSARDTFEMLLKSGITLIPKPFSVGVRVEHLQSDIDAALYNSYAGSDMLPPGEYSLARREGGRGCYSFCMCPGGYVVAAASEEGGIATNGMSFHSRSGVNSNAAICVSVEPSDFDSMHPLAGIEFQRKIERAAFAAAGECDKGIVQLYGDFLQNRPSSGTGRVQPTYPRGFGFYDINRLLPEFVCRMIKDSMPYFGRRLRGFDAYDTVFTAPETRTSSPVRIPRNVNMMSEDLYGLIPCGEGAGYAGGIVSAAVDGIRAAEAIMNIYAPLR